MLLWTLKHGSKSIQTSLILWQRPPKPYKLCMFFTISVIFLKIGKHIDFHLSYFQIVGGWRDFTVVRKLNNIFKSLYGSGGRSLIISDVCMDFELCFKVHNLVYAQLKRIKLGQTINLNVTFHVMVSIYRLLQIKFETRPSSLRNFGTAYIFPTIFWSTFPLNCRNRKTVDFHVLDLNGG